MAKKPLFDIVGKTALITGAAKRIGREVALALAEEGVNVVVHYRRSLAEAEDLMGRIRGFGVRAWGVSADFDRPDEYETLIERAFDAAGGIDFLVNNASIFPVGKLADVTFEDVCASARVNAWVPFALSRHFAARVREGKIINFLDMRVAGLDSVHAAYFLSKMMLATLTRMTALEFAPNVTVNAVAPGLILPPEGKDEAYLNALADKVPLKRAGSPADIADTILFLLKSRYITGQVIFVDGGRNLRGVNLG